MLLLTLGLHTAQAQVSERKPDNASSASEEEPAAEIWMHMAGGKRFQVDDVNEDESGYWYKRGNMWQFVDRSRVASVERSSPVKVTDTDESLPTPSRWRISDATRIEAFYLSRFGRALPIGTLGQSNLHTLWGLDHRNGMDISLHPDSAEGKVLISFLRTEGIPFLTFRGPIPRVATGPHIHIGNPSPRVKGQSSAR